MNVQTKAAEFLIALEWGYASLSEITTWADDKIAASEDPEIDLIEIALCKTKPKAIERLRKVSEHSDEWLALRHFFNRFKDLETLSVTKASTLAKSLFFKSMYDNDCPSEFGVFESHWDAIDLARDGASRITVEQSISDFLADLKALAISTS